MKAILALIVLVSFLASTPAPSLEPTGEQTTDAGWQRAGPGFEWNFPLDHWAHPDFESEWWYLTGHLHTTHGRRFAYQFTFFRVGLLQSLPDFDSPWVARDLVMGHAALVDIDRGGHRFSEVLYRAVPLLGGFAPRPEAVPPGRPASVSSNPDSAGRDGHGVVSAFDLAAPSLLVWSRAPAGTAGWWQLHYNGAAFDLSMADSREGFAMQLSTQPAKPLVFQGPGGYSAKATGPNPGASQYYSFTRLATTGHLVLDGDTLQVTGESWMDKEFGSDKLSEHQIGWDWFSLQLTDGRELMLYLLRDTQGTVDHASGTVVDVDGSPRYVDADQIEITTDARWTSPQTGAIYPAGWTVRVGEEAWRVTPLLPNQENVSARVDGLFYWEGAVDVSRPNGASAGRGFVELTGYGNGRRPGI